MEKVEGEKGSKKDVITATRRNRKGKGKGKRLKFRFSFNIGNLLNFNSLEHEK